MSRIVIWLRRPSGRYLTILYGLTNPLAEITRVTVDSDTRTTPWLGLGVTNGAYVGVLGVVSRPGELPHSKSLRLDALRGGSLVFRVALRT